MDIQMTGIDHSMAGVRLREQFSFTASQAERAMQEIKKQPGVKGCVLLSTCNRMELYVSTKESSMDLPGLLFSVRSVPCGGADIRQYFKSRQGVEAARHLFYLSAGLKSRILGEDQILAQVKEAVKKAREIYCADTLLEVLFRHAVTAGKEVRTKALSVHADYSAVHCAADGLKRQGYVLAGKRCLIIGNGTMGKIAAGTLRDEGALVTVTVRQYRSGIVEIPKGCSRIDYGDRYRLIPECDIILSATVSPNLTVRKEPLVQARSGRQRPQIYIDLAVPRDMEEDIAQLEGVTLYDIDSFQNDGSSSEMQRQKEQAGQLLETRLSEFLEWQECRELVPGIHRTGERAAEDICWRMGRGLMQFPEGEREAIRALAAECSQKVVEKMLFALRDELGREELARCMQVWEQMDF